MHKTAIPFTNIHTKYLNKPIHTRDFIIQTKPIKSNRINDHYF